MTKTEIKVGQEIIQIAHPEYGTWVITEHYSEGMWNVDKTNRRGGICTCESELLKFWEVVSN